MPFFGVPIRNGLPIGLGSVAGFGAPQEFTPAELFIGGTAGTWYDPSDLTTMFTTAAGTTPVAMPGQGSAVSVGLMLDKSQNGVNTNGSFRYNRATYTQTFGTSWANSGITITSTNNSAPDGTLTASLLTASGTLAYVYNSFSTNPTATNVCSLHVKAGTATVFWLYFNSSASDGVAYFDLFDLTTQAVAGSSQAPANLTISNLGSGWYRISASWNNSQPTFNWGFGFCDAKGSQNCTLGKNGQVWGFQLQSGTTPTTYQRIDANWYSTMAGNHAIAINDSTARPELRARVNLLVATATLSTQSVTTQATSYTLSFAGTGSITLSGTATGTYSAGTHTITCTAGTLTLTVSGTVTTADLRPANSGALLPAYQAVVDANTYDTSGFPLYLRFDGIDDSMYTPANLNLSSTDKVSVFAGVRKLSDAVEGMLVEFSPNFNGNTGSFLAIPNSSGTGAANTYTAAARGSSVASISQFAISTATPAPVTNVFTATNNISGDLSAIRLNGAASGTNGVGDKGSGNFGTYPLYIGSRGGSSLWLNGHLYSLAVVGSAVSAGNITAMENWIAGKTGIVI